MAANNVGGGSQNVVSVSIKIIELLLNLDLVFLWTFQGKRKILCGQRTSIKWLGIQIKKKLLYCEIHAFCLTIVEQLQ